MEQTDQYREILLKHSRHPSHAGNPSSFEKQGSCKNPLCGDAVDVGVSLNGGVIERIEIRASGCGISTASASMMTELVEGRSISEAMMMFGDFQKSLAEGQEWSERIASLAPFSRLRESPTRVPCALIGWFALKDAVKTVVA